MENWKEKNAVFAFASFRLCEANLEIIYGLDTNEVLYLSPSLSLSFSLSFSLCLSVTHSIRLFILLCIIFMFRYRLLHQKGFLNNRMECQFLLRHPLSQGVISVNRTWQFFLYWVFINQFTMKFILMNIWKQLTSYFFY